MDAMVSHALAIAAQFGYRLIIESVDGVQSYALVKLSSGCCIGYKTLDAVLDYLEMMSLS